MEPSESKVRSIVQDRLIKNGAAYAYRDLIVTAFPPQEDLAVIYMRAKREGLFEAFFNLDPKPPELNEFLLWSMDTKTVTFAAYLKTPGESLTGLAPIGMGKLGALYPMGEGKTKAEVSMLFFREYQRRAWTIPACQVMIEMIFDNAPTTKIDRVFGSTPEQNRASLRFMKAIGFQHLKEPIPGYSVYAGKSTGLYVSWLTAERWLELRPFA